MPYARFLLRASPAIPRRSRNPLVGSGTDCQLLAVAEPVAPREYVFVSEEESANVVDAAVAAVTKKLESSVIPTVSRMTA